VTFDVLEFKVALQVTRAVGARKIISWTSYGFPLLSYTLRWHNMSTWWHWFLTFQVCKFSVI